MVVTFKGFMADFNLGSLRDLTVDLRRELRKKINSNTVPKGIPSEDFLVKHFSDYFVNDQEIQILQDGVNKLDMLITRINYLEETAANNPHAFELVNIQRMRNSFMTIPNVLVVNLEELKRINMVQRSLIKRLHNIFECAKQNPSNENFMKQGQEIFAILTEMIHTQNGVINADEKIKEASVAHMVTVIDSLNEGLIFHKNFNDQMSSTNYRDLRNKINPAYVQINDELTHLALPVSKAVQVAYNLNIKHIWFMQNLYAMAVEVFERVK